MGKLAIAGYAILAVNVMAGILKPSRIYLESLCRTARTSTAVMKHSKQEEESIKKKED